MVDYEPLGTPPADSEPLPPPPPPPPSPRRPRWPVVAGVVAVVAMLAALLVVFAAGDGDGDTAGTRDDSPAEATSTTAASEDDPGGAPASREEIAAAVADLSRFVADARQREFLRPVQVELLDDDAFVDRLLRDIEEDRADIEADESVLRALRLIDSDVDLFEAFTGLLGAGVVGFYDPETEELVVRGADLTPYVRSTLVHELTHALDDQHFELDRDALEDAEDEREYAFSAVYEGNAVRVEDDWLATRTEEERQAAAREELSFGTGIDISRFPRFLVSIIAFPYLVGEQLVDRLEEEGGEARIDEALRNPPTTTEQVIHPVAYLGGEAGVPVALPPSEGQVIDQGVVGQWVLYLILQDALGQEAAGAAANGWGGDAYVAWDDGERACVRATFVMDSGSDLGELVAALEDWTQQHGDATVQASTDDVQFTACG